MLSSSENIRPHEIFQNLGKFCNAEFFHFPHIAQILQSIKVT